MKDGEKPKNCLKMYSAILEERTKKTEVSESLREVQRSSSKQEHKENALASGAEERRDKLR